MDYCVPFTARVAADGKGRDHLRMVRTPGSVVAPDAASSPASQFAGYVGQWDYSPTPMETSRPEKGPPTVAAARRRKRWLTIVGVVTAGLLVSVLVTARLFVWPSQHVPAEADAVVVLAGGVGERLERGLELMELGVSDTLVLNRAILLWGDGAYKDVWDLCDSGSVDFEVVCLVSLPDNTKGEALTISELARERSWNSLAIVTTDSHLHRSMLWFKRCYSGELYPVPADSPFDRSLLMHEIGGTAEALFLDRDCSIS